MVAPRLSAIDALRSKPPGDASRDRPDEILPPPSTVGFDLAGCPDSLKFRAAARGELSARHIGRGRSVDVLDVPGTRRNGERAFDPAPVGERRRKHDFRARVAVEGSEEPPAGIE